MSADALTLRKRRSAPGRGDPVATRGHPHIDEGQLEALLGLDTSKIGFYSDVKQKIRELEAANQDLSDKRNELQAVFNAIGDGVAIFDLTGRVQYRNRVCLSFFGGDNLTGKRCSDIFHPGRATAAETCPVEGALNGESRQLSFTINRGREIRYLEAAATPIADPLGQPRSALVLLRDVTEKRNQELQLLQAEKMSNIGVLAAGVAHEINNPVASIALYAEALLRRIREVPHRWADPELGGFPDYLNVIVREAYRCKAIVDSLVSFSRRSDGTMEAVSLNPLVGEVLDLVRPMARQGQVEVVEELAPESPAVRGDAAAIRQVILNLALNALQAIKGAGTLSISTFSERDSSVLRVVDTGCGIPPEHIDQIWTPFFTTKPVGQGLGLGLSVTYNIVQKHGGEILVDSAEGSGSTFVVRLPADRQDT